jgi:hypothetical protein
VICKQQNSRVGAQAVLSFEQSLVGYLETSAVLDQDDRALLLRWVEDGRANEVWDTFRAYYEQHKGATAPDAEISFIELILSAKKMAVTKSEMIREKDFARWRTRLVKAIKSAPDEVLFPFLELVIARYRSGLEPLLASPSRVRSDKNGSRAKTLFIRDVSAAVRELTGRRLDKEIAVITEIAFGIKDIDVDTVRKARAEKARPK